MSYKKETIHKRKEYTTQSSRAVETDATVFSLVASNWFETIKLQTKESTQNKYFNLLTNYILPTYGEQPLESITYEFIEVHCNFLLTAGGKKGMGLSPKTVTDVLAVIRNILKFAVRKGYYVPCDGSAIQVKRVMKPIRVLSKQEQERLCNYILRKQDSYHIGILVCLFTGLRVGEICALRWEDVSFVEQTIYVHHTLQRVQNKSGQGEKTKIVITTPKSVCSIRTIPMPDELRDILAAYQTSATGFLLTNDEIEFVEPRTMQNQFKKALQASGIEAANFHAIRHTFATRCVELGFDVKSLSEILGHATVNITMNRYVHPTLELKKENMKKLSSLLNIS